MESFYERNMKRVGLFITCLCCILLLSTPFVENSALMGEPIHVKIFWVHLISAFVSLTLMPILFNTRLSTFRFNWADVLILLYFGSILITYDWTFNPEPEKLLLGGQFIILWFALRIHCSIYPVLRHFLVFVIATIGLLEALLGLSQLYGFAYSHHALFNMTGTFQNPGPYSGFLAIILPICLFSAFRNEYYLLRLYYGMCSVVIFIILPAGMSRSAWLAAFISCLGVLIYIYKADICQWLISHRVYSKMLSVSIPILLIAALIGMYYIKQDSADGRILMWRVTSDIVRDRPVSGTGLGGFPATYAHAQAEYLNSATVQEKYVAGCPEYAFNEYLQIAAEQGIFSLLLFLGFLGSLFYYALKSHYLYAIGGLIALGIFAFSSYPFQLLEFWILFICLGVISVSQASLSTINVSLFLKRVFIFAAILTSIILFVQAKTYYTPYVKWCRLKVLYSSNNYEAALSGYEPLYPYLRHKPEYLFELGRCYLNTNNPQQAIPIFTEASQLSSDPMIYYLLAKSEQAAGCYSSAESHLLYAIRILPERIYPYYLLVQLYALPAYYSPQKLKIAADSVLLKRPKVENTATWEMRKGVKQILKNSL